MKNGSNNIGEYTEDGFIVYKDSTVTQKEAKQLSINIRFFRKKLIKNNFLKEKGDLYIFTDNYSFNSLSTAASVVLGRSANGWIEWKDKKGKTIDEILRNIK